MPLRGANGALTFELGSRWYWLLRAAGFAAYGAVIVLITAVGIESRAGRWLLFVAALMAVNGLVGTTRLIAQHVRRVVLEGGDVTIVTVSETRVIPVASITRIGITPRFVRVPGVTLWFGGGTAFLRNVGLTPDRPIDVVRALIELRPDIPVSGRWSPPVPLEAGPPQYSPDGQWRWNGHEWLPNSPLPPPP